MARKELTLVIDAQNRDTGKTFRIREMSAVDAERWATRALMALMRSGVEIPDNIASAGLAGVAAMGFRAFGGMHYADAEPLLAQMLACVSYVPNPSLPMTVISGPMMETQIEEISTLLRLREEVISLHINFSLAEYRLKLTTALKTDGLPSIETSQR